jgi:RNA polymerase sigma-70 factor (ECF subfamily)
MYSDTDLLNQIKQRDSVAIERLYDRYEKTLFLLLSRTQVDEALIHSAMTELFRTV